MLGGAAPELEIAMPQPGVYVRDRTRLLKSAAEFREQVAMGGVVKVLPVPSCPGSISGPSASSPRLGPLLLGAPRQHRRHGRRVSIAQRPLLVRETTIRIARRWLRVGCATKSVVRS